MFFSSGQAFRAWPTKAITLIGMSGSGKTFLSNFLRHTAQGWYHYSVDYRIGSFYLKEDIADVLRQEAAKTPLLKALMLKDAVAIDPKLSFDNLTALSAYLGKPGNPRCGGLALEEYKARLKKHHCAEINALHDALNFQQKAKQIYGYENFICDTSGSICEVVDPLDDQDAVLKELFEHSVIVYLEGSTADREALISRFLKAPKPIYYPEHCLDTFWSDYLKTHTLTEAQVDPDAFSCWAFEKLIDARLPKYQQISERWGYSVAAADLATCKNYDDIETVIVHAIDAKNVE